MKLEEAIKILTDLKDAGIDAGHYDAEDAIQLGIEAIERCIENRKYHTVGSAILLPGETED